MRPLEGITVLDFTWVLSGPFATRLLADYGANVIKIQSLETLKTPKANEDPYFKMWNRNKKSIEINMNTQEGLDEFRRLVKTADVVIDNFSPHVLRRWGISYDALKVVNPGIIMAQISAAGNDSDMMAFGPGIGAMAGLGMDTSLGPVVAGYAYADHIMGLTASMEILNAIINRNNTQEGAYIEINGLKAIEAVCAERDKSSYEFNSAAGFCVKCRDNKYCAISSENENLRQIAFEDAGKLAAAELTKKMQQLNVAAYTVLDAEGIFTDEHIKSRGFLQVIDGELYDRGAIRFLPDEPCTFEPAPAFNSGIL